MKELTIIETSKYLYYCDFCGSEVLSSDKCYFCNKNICDTHKNGSEGVYGDGDVFCPECKIKKDKLRKEELKYRLLIKEELEKINNEIKILKNKKKNLEEPLERFKMEWN